MAIASLLFSSSSRTVNFTLHPAMLHCRLAPSAVAELAKGAEIVVDVEQLVHGAKIEAVGTVGPDAPRQQQLLCLLCCCEGTLLRKLWLSLTKSVSDFLTGISAHTWL